MVTVPVYWSVKSTTRDKKAERQSRLSRLDNSDTLDLLARMFSNFPPTSNTNIPKYQLGRPRCREWRLCCQQATITYRRDQHLNNTCGSRYPRYQDPQRWSRRIREHRYHNRGSDGRKGCWDCRRRKGVSFSQGMLNTRALTDIWTTVSNSSNSTSTHLVSILSMANTSPWKCTWCTKLLVCPLFSRLPYKSPLVSQVPD